MVHSSRTKRRDTEYSNRILFFEWDQWYMEFPISPILFNLKIMRSSFYIFTLFVNVILLKNVFSANTTSECKWKSVSIIFWKWYLLIFLACTVFWYKKDSNECLATTHFENGKFFILLIFIVSFYIVDFCRQNKFKQFFWLFYCEFD